MIENERVRSAFAYFNNRFARRRPRKKPVEQETLPERENDMVKSPSSEASQQLSEAIADSSTSTRKAIMRHCPRVASRYKLKNKDYNLMRMHSAETAAILIEMEQMADIPPANYLIRRLETHTELSGLNAAQV